VTQRRLRPDPFLPRLLFLLVCWISASGQTTNSVQTVEAVLQQLRQSGVDVIYSSELVAPDMLAPASGPGTTPLQRANDALAAHGLALRSLGAKTFVVVLAPAAPAVTEVEDRSMR
jgi:hypothetical protein